MSEQILEPSQNQATRSGPIRVAVVEDLRDIREGLTWLIEASDGFTCVGSFRSMEEALSHIGKGAPAEPPDIALLDISLPGMSGIDGVRILSERHPEILLIMLTVHDDDERIFEALSAGARGYLLKKTQPARLLESLRDAMEGGASMSPEIARRVIDLFKGVRPAKREEFELTPHETRILRLLADGHNYRTAAAELGVTVHAVSFHLRSIYEKLHVRSKTEAVAKALKHRLLG